MIDFGSLGVVLFFRAYTPADGEELWTSDGTSAGTVLFKDIYPGCTQPAFGGCKVNSSNPRGFIFANGFLSFVASDETGRHLWCRRMVLLIQTLKVNDLVLEDPDQSMASYNGWLYFRAEEPAGAPDNHGWELWRTNGEPGSAELVADINPAGDAYPNDLIVSSDNRIFLLTMGSMVRNYGKPVPPGPRWSRIY